MTNIKDIIWLSGFMEGEGTFYTQDFRYPTLQVGSSDYDVLLRAAKILKCQDRITEHKSKMRDGYIRKKHYRLSIGGNYAVGWMMTIYPLMGIRRKEKIKEIILNWRNYAKKYSMSKQAIKARFDRSIIIKDIRPYVLCVNPFVTKGLGVE